MTDPARILANPVLAFVLRVTLGGYVIYMSRRFYVDPFAYLRNAARWTPEFPQLLQIVRALAVFCLWGGCFIVGTAIAVEIFDLHGQVLALALIVMAAIATWFLIPNVPGSGAERKSRVQD